MFKKLSLLLILLVFLFTPLVKAEGEFSSSYNVLYDVDENGVTTVTEQITFKNLTDRFYPSNFNLVIAASDIPDISAYDLAGLLPVTFNKQDKTTTIKVSFNNQQIVGKGKEYKWTLTFKSTDFAQKSGKIWQISVPKVKDSKDLDTYSLTVSVPVSFGDPTTILPEPVKQSESGGKINFIFNKKQLTESGVLANFGSLQLIDFNATYNLVNNRLLPYLLSLPLPPDTDYQEVTIDRILPSPENVLTDEEGNFTALFRLDRKQSIQVNVAGQARVHTKVFRKRAGLSAEEMRRYTQSEKFWDKNNPVIQAKAAEILKNSPAKTNLEKARLLDKYVADWLQFDSERVKNNDFVRLGALAALNNPDKALAAEYTDLFIALARASHIPARQLIGFANSTNLDIRPLSYHGKNLHSWVEIYDPVSGWQMIDPTWESTSSGVDYFSSFDLNHLVLARIGSTSQDQYSITDLQTGFSESKLNPKQQLNLVIDVSDEVLAGFPATLKIRAENAGNVFFPSSEFSLNADKVALLPSQPKLGQNFYELEAIAPFGFLEREFSLRTGGILQSFDDTLKLKVGDQKLQKRISVKPFYVNRYFTFFISLVVILIVLIYCLTLILHLKIFKNLHSKVKLKS